VGGSRFGPCVPGSTALPIANPKSHKSLPIIAAAYRQRKTLNVTQRDATNDERMSTGVSNHPVRPLRQSHSTSLAAIDFQTTLVLRPRPLHFMSLEHMWRFIAH
jgi:hypothetical protein